MPGTPANPMEEELIDAVRSAWSLLNTVATDDPKVLAAKAVLGGTIMVFDIERAPE